MAASLMIFTGHPNADLKLNPTHVFPRLCGSAAGLPLRTRPGYQIDTTSYFQSLAISLTPETICFGVIFGPDGNFRGSFCPVARTLTLVPPTSIASTFMTRPLLAGTTPGVGVTFSERVVAPAFNRPRQLEARLSLTKSLPSTHSRT